MARISHQNKLMKKQYQEVSHRHSKQSLRKIEHQSEPIYSSLYCPCNGSCPRCTNAVPLKSKMNISQSNGRYEEEANRIAKEVKYKTNLESKEDSNHNRSLSKEITPLDQKVLGVDPNPYHQSLRGRGQPLDHNTLTDMDNVFGYDFKNVRLHSDIETQQTALTLGARAFTIGTDIGFNKKEDITDTELIAHELTHVIQQRYRNSSPCVIQCKPEDLGDSRIKAPWIEVDLKRWLWNDLIYARSEYENAKSNSDKNFYRNVYVSDAKAKFRIGMKLLRLAAKGVEPPKNSVAWPVFHSTNSPKVKLDNLFQALRKIQTEDITRYADAFRGSELLEEKVRERKGKDPYYKEIKEGDYPEDNALADKYEEEIFGKTISFLGIKIKRSKKIEDIKIPEELKQFEQ
jgi:hypothetical protein